MTAKEMWQDYYTNRFPKRGTFYRRAYDQLRRRFWDAFGPDALTAYTWGNAHRAECDARSRRILDRREREDERETHALHIHMNEAGRYSWCRQCRPA